MTVEKAVEILNIHQKWRIGEIEEMPYSPKIITEALGLLLGEFKKKAKKELEYKAKYEKCISVIKRFDAGIIGMYDL